MRELALWMVTTVDGFIATSDGELWDRFPWPDDVQRFAVDTFRDADTVVYGRGTFEAIVPWWDAVARGEPPNDEPVSDAERELAAILRGVRKVLVSRTARDPGYGSLVVGREAASEVAKLKEQSGARMLLHCGPALLAELNRSELVDECILIVCPVVLGSGISLFAGIEAERPLTLSEASAFGSGWALLRYRMSPLQR
jgi:dihydrofolate reductase